jgi:hypothetical protein
VRLTDGVVASLTEKIYDAALAPEAWQALALDLAQVLRGQVAICRHAEQPIGIYAVTGTLRPWQTIRAIIGAWISAFNASLAHVRGSC